MKIIAGIFLLFAGLTLVSCSNKDKASEDKVMDNSDTVQPVKGVLFSSVMLNDFLQTEDDEDLGEYLETQVYPLVSGFTKVSMDRIASSVYSLDYDSAGVSKSYIIERFYSPKDEKTIFTISVPAPDDTDDGK